MAKIVAFFANLTNFRYTEKRRKPSIYGEYARVAELVDAADLKSVGRKAVGVRVLIILQLVAKECAEGSKIKAFSRYSESKSSPL